VFISISSVSQSLEEFSTDLSIRLIALGDFSDIFFFDFLFLDGTSNFPNCCGVTTQEVLLLCLVLALMGNSCESTLSGTGDKGLFGGGLFGGGLFGGGLFGEGLSAGGVVSGTVLPRLAAGETIGTAGSGSNPRFKL
jgi:hypothetical protein